MQRYIRQTSLGSFGADGQAKLADGRVLVVGLGGLGLPIVQYLNAMGLGTIGLMDQDVVELHNLQRQVLYHENDIGKPKLEVTLDKLNKQNSTTILQPFATFLTRENALETIKDFDIVVDATDNFATRYLINDACVILEKPFVYGALHGFEGQVSVFNHKDGPTYRCLFPKMPKPDEIPNCNENGVLGILPGIIGTLQALEVVKLLTDVGEVLSGKLLLFDGLTQNTQKITFDPNPKNKRIKTLQETYGVASCETVPSLTPEAFAILFENDQVQLIDVRNSNEFDGHHLEGAINIPLPDMETEWQKIDFTIPVYLICQSGKRSELALKKLQEYQPASAVYHILGGMNKMASLCS